MQQVRKQGYADDNEEFEEGLRCLAAPIRDHTGAVAASLGIAGPAARVEAARLPELIKLVKDGAEAVSAALGYRGVDSSRAAGTAGQGGRATDAQPEGRPVGGQATRGSGMGGLAK